MAIVAVVTVVATVRPGQQSFPRAGDLADRAELGDLVGTLTHGAHRRLDIGDTVNYMDVASSDGSNRQAHHLGCPYCVSYEVDRLYVASAAVDACSCRACGAEWDEVLGSGEIKGRSQRHSVLLHG